ncbi:MAG: uL15m family ribosomal protein [Candidatus Aenigmatarchaeota archaeon]|nr:LSU ribosomal protein L15P [Candidatus Kryptobacter tengchongensis]
MVVRKEKKHRKFRGKRTYHGSHKKARGGGSRGGRGKAGLHKHKWSYVVKYEPDHFGKVGFKPPKSKKIKSINLSELDKIAKEKNLDKINVVELGYEKVLGSGKLSKPLIIEAKFFSKKAIKRIEEAGGKAVKIE